VSGGLDRVAGWSIGVASAPLIRALEAATDPLFRRAGLVLE
jgi:hypothetical protein